MHRLLRAAALLAAFTTLCSAAPAGSLYDDAGSYRVYHGEQALGTEHFSFETHGDSIFVFAHIYETLPTPAGMDSLEKHVAMALEAEEFDLRAYQSNTRVAGRWLRRRLDLRDTSFTSYIEDDNGGQGHTLVRPPGRMYVLEPRAFALFDLVFRGQHRSSLEERPISVLYLGTSRDTIIEAKVRRLGPETIRWGARTVAAESFSLSDNTSEFRAWVSPEGKMLRLTQEAVGLRVERLPSRAERQAPRAVRPSAGVKRR
jgi:hypothetical protein